MSKGGYTCICYPKGENSLESLNLTIEDLEKSIMKDGGGFAYILHDKEDCKTHYHIACMWEKSVMPWDDTDKRQGFLNWMKSHACVAPVEDAREAKQKGLTLEEIKYNRDVCTVRNIKAVLAYWVHSNGTEKEE